MKSVPLTIEVGIREHERIEAARPSLAPRFEGRRRWLQAILDCLSKLEPLVSTPLRYAALVTVSRLLLLGILAIAMKGVEFTSDVAMHMEMVRAPIDVLLGTSRHGQHPPFLALVEGLTAYPLQLFLDDFYALRMTYLLWEGVAAFLFWKCLRIVIPSPRRRGIILALFALLPVGWMTSVVMVQDEVISMAFMLGITWLVLSHRDWQAVLLCGLAVVAAKIFFLLPLVALVLLGAWRSVGWRAMLGGGPIALIYGFQAGMSILGHREMALAAFTPPIYFCVNIWTLVDHLVGVDSAVARYQSALLAAIAAFIPLMILLVRRRRTAAEALNGLIVVMLAGAFALFYHVNPDYLLLIFPGLLIFFPRLRTLLLTALATTLPYVVNVFFGVRHALEHGTGGGKGKIAALYQAWVPLSADSAFVVALLLSSVALIWLAVHLNIQLLGEIGVESVASSRPSRAGSARLDQTSVRTLLGKAS